MLMSWLFSSLLLVQVDIAIDSGRSDSIAPGREGPTVLTIEDADPDPEALCGVAFTCEAHGPMGKFFGECSVSDRNELAQIALEICASEVE